MDFLGKDMKAAPKLRDAEYESVEQFSLIYLETIKLMRILYQ